MNPAQLALHAACELAMSNGETTPNALLAVFTTSLTDGLVSSGENFSVCIEYERKAVTALGDRGTFLEIGIQSDGKVKVERHTPPCAFHFNGNVAPDWNACVLIKTLKAAALRLQGYPISVKTDFVPRLL
jgi:hypothetical protein